MIALQFFFLRLCSSKTQVLHLPPHFFISLLYSILQLDFYYQTITIHALFICHDEAKNGLFYVCIPMICRKLDS